MTAAATTMALMDAPQHLDGPTLFGLPMKQVSLITVSEASWGIVYWRRFRHFNVA